MSKPKISFYHHFFHAFPILRQTLGNLGFIQIPHFCSAFAFFPRELFFSVGFLAASPGRWVQRSANRSWETPPVLFKKKLDLGSFPSMESIVLVCQHVRTINDERNIPWSSMDGMGLMAFVLQYFGILWGKPQTTSHVNEKDCTALTASLRHMVLPFFSIRFTFQKDQSATNIY